MGEKREFTHCFKADELPVIGKRDFALKAMSYGGFSVGGPLWGRRRGFPRGGEKRKRHSWK